MTVKREGLALFILSLTLVGSAFSLTVASASPQASTGPRRSDAREFNPQTNANTIILHAPPVEYRPVDNTGFRSMDPSYTNAYGLPPHHEELFRGLTSPIGTPIQCYETVYKKLCPHEKIHEACQQDASPVFQSCMKSLLEAYGGNCLDLVPRCVGRSTRFAQCMSEMGLRLKVKAEKSEAFCSSEMAYPSDVVEINKRTNVSAEQLLDIPLDRLSVVRHCVMARGDSQSEGVKAVNECYMRHTNSRRPLIEVPKPELVSATPAAAESKAPTKETSKVRRRGANDRALNSMEALSRPIQFSVPASAQPKSKVPSFTPPAAPSK
ncbi:MAG: hypothetical protein AB7N80_11600 [Bdellovibrionales bacterium]